MAGETLKEFLEKNHLTINDNAKLLFEKLDLPMETLKDLEDKYGKSDKMSKSKHNTVDPDEMIEKYGADTVRLYILFAAPPQNNFDWIDSGVEGANRFLKRVWNLIISNLELVKDIHYSKEDFKNIDEESKKIRRKLHQTIKKVNEDIVREYQFNTAIASIMELLNELQSYKEKNPKVLRESFENLVLLLSPFTPFISDELWRILGNEGYTVQQQFPVPDEEALIETTKEIPVQVNGKVRATITVPADADEELVKQVALENENVKKWIEGKNIIKVIFIKGKILNIVVK